ncbi:MAG TPA: agmatinase, partial [Bacteroidales bacterium]|nr:agmatinase [Bacteroidales bacterium]
MVHFGDIPQEFCNKEKSRIVILPIPYDGTSTWVKGSDKGPEALLEASANMELYDIETDTEVYLQGIYTALAIKEDKSPEAMVAASEKEATKYLEQGKFLVTIGGEHSVSIGPISAYAKKYANLSVLQIDAHADLRDSYEGSKNNHACVMARAQDLCPIVQVGIRSMDVDEKKRLDLNRVF